MKLSKGLFASVLALGLVFGGTQQASAAGDAEAPINFDWSFGGMFGKFDRAQLQRGFQVYKEVCATCHSLERIYFRNLAEPGGPEFNLEAVKALAREAQIVDLDADGETVERNGRLSDVIPGPYANLAQASAALGATPPDLSLITKSRTAVRPLHQSFLDAFTGRSALLGSDYVASLLQGYEDPPADTEEDKLPGDGQYWNRYYPGHIIGMAAPLSDGDIEYTQEGVPQTVEQYALDVTAFLMWTAEPHLEQRKSLGVITLAFLVVLAILFYFSNKMLWRDIKGKKEESA